MKSLGRHHGWIKPLILLSLIGMVSCHSGYTRNDPVLEKPLEQLTAADMARMVAMVSTNYGNFIIQLRPDWAPETCRNFVKLAAAGFYNGMTIHEILPRIWIRGGDPKGDGTGGPGYHLELEPSTGKHVPGAVGLYHANFFPNEGGSQFYIMTSNLPEMDRAYALFGQVIDGMATVQRIANLPTTPRNGKPWPFMPLSPVVIKDLHLEVKK